MFLYKVLYTTVSPHLEGEIGHQGVSARRARGRGGPGVTGALEGVPWAARSRIFGAERRREGRARGRRRKRQNARSGLAAVFWVDINFFFGCELLLSVRIDAPAGFTGRRRLRDDPRPGASPVPRTARRAPRGSWGVVSTTVTLYAMYITRALLSAPPERLAGTSTACER